MSTGTFEEPGVNRNEILRAALRCLSKAEATLDRADPNNEDDDSLSISVGWVTVSSHYLEVANAISRPATDFTPRMN